jgi:hypothetical protein
MSELLVILSIGRSHHWTYGTLSGSRIFEMMIARLTFVSGDTSSWELLLWTGQ